MFLTELFVLKLSICFENNKVQYSLQIYFITLISSHKRDVSGAILYFLFVYNNIKLNYENIIKIPFN